MPAHQERGLAGRARCASLSHPTIMDFSALAASIARLSRSLAALAAGAERLGVAAARGPGVVRSAPLQAAAAGRGAAAFDRGHRRAARTSASRWSSTTSPARRPAPPRRWPPARSTRLPRAAGLRRSGAAGAALRAFRIARLAIARRSAGRRGGSDRIYWRLGPQCAAAAGAGRRAGRRFRRDGELAAGAGGPADGRRADRAFDAAEIQRRGGEAVLPRGGRGRQADHRDLQFLRPGGRPRLLAAVAGPLPRGNGRGPGTGLRRAVRPRRGRRIAAAVLSA